MVQLLTGSLWTTSDKVGPLLNATTVFQLPATFRLTSERSLGQFQPETQIPVGFMSGWASCIKLCQIKQVELPAAVTPSGKGAAKNSFLCFDTVHLTYNGLKKFFCYF